MSTTFKSNRGSLEITKDVDCKGWARPLRWLIRAQSCARFSARRAHSSVHRYDYVLCARRRIWDVHWALCSSFIDSTSMYKWMTTYSIHFPTHFSFQKSFRLYSYKTCTQQKIFFSKCTMLFSHCTRFFCTLFKELKEKKMRKWFSVLFLVLSIWCLTCSWEKRLICHDIALADFSSASKFVMCCKVILWAARGIHKLQSIFFWIKFQNLNGWLRKWIQSFDKFFFVELMENVPKCL